MYKELGPAFSYINSLSSRDKAEVTNADGHVNLEEILTIVSNFAIGLNIAEYEAYGLSSLSVNGLSGIRKPRAFFNIASYKKTMMVGVVFCFLLQFLIHTYR